MRTCANVAHGLGGRGGYEPLPEAGEYVCDCYEHGTGEPWAHVGSSHVHERIVRCRDCMACDMADADWRGRYFCQNFREYVDLGGFCAWGERRAQ